MADVQTERRPGIIGLILRFVINAVVLLIISYLVPGFAIAGFWTALLAAVVIAVLDYAIQAIFKIDASPFGRGLSGFIVAAIILYLTQYIIAGVAVSFWGAIIAALVIGLVNLIIPGRIF
jgi:uncharacterized membrane protein YvlD (DUF360 family)